MSATYGTNRTNDVISAWSTDLRRNLRTIAQESLRPGESLIDYPREHDNPGKPSRFRIVRESPDCTCKVTAKTTDWDSACSYHGDSGSMVQTVHLS